MDQKIKIRTCHSKLLVFLLSLLFVSCQSGIVYESYRSLPQQEWAADSILRFNFAIDEPGNTYDVNINTRNLEKYPYSNLWLFLELMGPDSSSKKDTIEIFLARPSGEWLGKGSSGVYLNKYPYYTKVFFPMEGEYSLIIEQGMREEVLEGIREVGISIEKNKNGE